MDTKTKVLCLNNPGEDDKCECCNAGIKRQLKINVTTLQCRD